MVLIKKAITEVYVWKTPRLPAEYQEVKYIQSDWNAYINTWILANAVLQISIKLSDISMWSSYLDQYSYVVFWTTANSRWLSSTYYVNNWSRFRYHKWDWTKKYDDCAWTQTGVINSIDYYPSYFEVNWTTWSSVWTDTSWWDASNNEVCFWYCWNNSHSIYKMYSLEITTNDWVHRYVPCYRKLDNVIWLYDLLSETFYSNAWSWAFSKWWDILPYVRIWPDRYVPNSNTVAYYPFTSETTINDMKKDWTLYNLTNEWWVSFWTRNWVDCAYFDWGNSARLYNTALSFPAYPVQTVVERFYIEGTNSNYQVLYEIWWTTKTGLLWSWYNHSIWLALWSRDWSYEVIKSWDITWWRHCLMNITNWNSSVQYLDNVLYQTFTNGLSWTQSWIYFGRNWNNTSDNKMTWCLSEVIVENKARDETDRTIYYETTKSLYWIS